MKKIILSVLLCSMADLLFAQNSLEDYAKDVLNGSGSVVHSHGNFNIPPKYYVEDPLTYKRVGIMSIMVNFQGNAGATVQRNKQDLSLFAVEDFRTKEFANLIEPDVVSSLKTKGSSLGIEILTP